MSAAAPMDTVALPEFNTPDGDNRQAASASRLETYPEPETSVGDEGFRIVRGMLMGALLSLPFWIAVSLIIRALR